MFCLLAAHWLLVLQFYESSLVLPSVVNHTAEIESLVGARKNYTWVKRIGVFIALLEGIFTAVSIQLYDYHKAEWLFTMNLALLGSFALL